MSAVVRRPRRRREPLEAWLRGVVVLAGCIVIVLGAVAFSLIFESYLPFAIAAGIFVAAALTTFWRHFFPTTKIVTVSERYSERYGVSLQDRLSGKLSVEKLRNLAYLIVILLIAALARGVVTEIWGQVGVRVPFVAEGVALFAVIAITIGFLVFVGTRIVRARVKWQNRRWPVGTVSISLIFIVLLLWSYYSSQFVELVRFLASPFGLAPRRMGYEPSIVLLGVLAAALFGYSIALLNTQSRPERSVRDVSLLAAVLTLGLVIAFTFGLIAVPLVMATACVFLVLFLVATGIISEEVLGPLISSVLAIGRIIALIIAIASTAIARLLGRVSEWFAWLRFFPTSLGLSLRLLTAHLNRSEAGLKIILMIIQGDPDVEEAQSRAKTALAEAKRDAWTRYREGLSGRPG